MPIIANGNGTGAVHRDVGAIHFLNRYTWQIGAITGNRSVGRSADGPVIRFKTTGTGIAEDNLVERGTADSVEVDKGKSFAAIFAIVSAGDWIAVVGFPDLLIEPLGVELAD